MYIYLDESYNLKDRGKPQFISKARIHATDKRFKPLREKSIDLIYFSPDTFFITVFQDIREIPANKASFYYKKDKLDFEKVYEDLVKSLLDRLNLREYKKVIINIDNRKHREGMLGKKKFQENILSYLKQCYPNTIFCFRILPSASNILLEIADFISNTFYKQYIDQELGFLDKLKVKTIQIKNPLKN